MASVRFLTRLYTLSFSSGSTSSSGRGCSGVWVVGRGDVSGMGWGCWCLFWGLVSLGLSWRFSWWLLVFLYRVRRDSFAKWRQRLSLSYIRESRSFKNHHHGCVEFINTQANTYLVFGCQLVFLRWPGDKPMRWSSYFYMLCQPFPAGRRAGPKRGYYSGGHV